MIDIFTYQLRVQRILKSGNIKQEIQYGASYKMFFWFYFSLTNLNDLNQNLNTIFLVNCSCKRVTFILLWPLGDWDTDWASLALAGSLVGLSRGGKKGSFSRISENAAKKTGRWNELEFIVRFCLTSCWYKFPVMDESWSRTAHVDTLRTFCSASEIITAFNIFSHF